MSVVSAVLILPLAVRAAGDALSVAMGHADEGVSTYCTPLYAINGGEEPTHYACHAWVTPEFKATIEAAQGGTYPPWPAPLLALAQSVIPSLIASFGTNATEPTEHMEAITAANGVAHVQQA